jgi:hypothetical protein
MYTGVLFFISAIVLALLVSFAVPVLAFQRWQRKGAVIGCLLQPVVLLVVSFLLIEGYFAITDSMHHAGTMVCVRSIEEDRNCRFEETWYIKADGTCYYEFDKGSHSHSQEPCGNDSYGRERPVERIDSMTALKTELHLVVYFDLQHRKVTPVFGSDTIEVVSVDWDRVGKYFSN